MSFVVREILCVVVSVICLLSTYFICLLSFVVQQILYAVVSAMCFHQIIWLNLTYMSLWFLTDTPKNEDSLEEEESSESDNELGSDGGGGEDNDEVASVEGDNGGKMVNAEDGEQEKQ